MEGDGWKEKTLFFLKTNTIMKIDRWVARKLSTINVTIRWRTVMFILGDVLDLRHEKGFPDDYVTIADRESRIPYGLWRFDGKTLTRVHPLPKNNEADHQ